MKYYEKKLSETELISELLSSIIAKEINLKTPELQVKIKDNEYYLLSKDFKENKEFVSGIYNSPKILSIPYIYTSIEEYEKLYKKLENDDIFLLQILKMSIYDGFRNEQDRTYNNYFFEKDNYKNMILLDHSNSFTEGFFIKNEQFTLSRKSDSMVNYLKKYQELEELVYKLYSTNIEEYFKKLFDIYNISISNKQETNTLKLVKTNKKVFNRWLKKI